MMSSTSIDHILDDVDEESVVEEEEELDDEEVFVEVC